LNELYIVEGAVQNLDTAMKHRMSSLIGPASISKVPNACGRGCTNGRHIDLLDSGYLPTQSPNGDITKYYVAYGVNGTPFTNFDQWTVVHELGHVWDGSTNGQLHKDLVNATNGRFYPAIGCDPQGRLPGCNYSRYRYGGTPAKGSDYNFNPKEDFAESVAAYVFPDEAHQSLMNMLNDIRTGVYGQAEKSWYPTLFQYLYYADYRQTSRWQFINNRISER